MNLGQYLEPVRKPGGRPWTAKEMRMLGTAPDDVIAQRTGRTSNAVCIMRVRLSIRRKK
jgi:hypothetical protein